MHVCVYIMDYMRLSVYLLIFCIFAESNIVFFLQLQKNLTTYEVSYLRTTYQNSRGLFLLEGYLH